VARTGGVNSRGLCGRIELTEFQCDDGDEGVWPRTPLPRPASPDIKWLSGKDACELARMILSPRIPRAPAQLETTLVARSIGAQFVSWQLLQYARRAQCLFKLG